MTIIHASTPFQASIQRFDAAGSTASAATRTLTALPGGAIAVDDTFVRRTIVAPQAWMQQVGAACAVAQQQLAASTQAPPPAKKKRKKKGLKKIAKKVKTAAKKGLKKLKQVVKTPLSLVKQALGLAMNPLQLLGGGLPRQ